MAAENLTPERVAAWLDAGPRMLEELSDAAEQWDEMPDWEQVDWSLEWDQYMNVLEHVLAPAYRTGHMTAGQGARYQALLVGLKEALPLIQKLNLTRPPVSLDAAA